MADEKKPKHAGRDRSGETNTSPRKDPTVRKGYEAAEDPEPQGDGDPGPESATEQPGKE